MNISKLNNYFIKHFSYMLSAIFYICFAVNAYTFEIEAKQAILVDHNTGQILYGKNTHEKMHPSSMTKMMTAYIVFDHIKQGKLAFKDRLKVSKKARNRQSDESRMFLEQGSMVSVEDLLKGITVQSGNDASIVIAESVAGSTKNFSDLMNQYAQKLGMKDTLFRNCCGLPEDKHLSTAYDLYLLSKALINDFPEYYHLFSIKEFAYNNIKQPNWNFALGKLGVDGIKTGHTSAGGHGVAISAFREEDGRRLIAVINGVDGYKKRTKESLKLIEYGFDGFELKEIVYCNSSKPFTSAKIAYGKASEVELIAQDSIMLYVDKESKDGLHIKISYDDFVSAPVLQDQVLGSVSVLDEHGNVLGQTLLTARNPVEKAGIAGRIIYNFKRIFSKIH